MDIIIVLLSIRFHVHHMVCKMSTSNSKSEKGELFYMHKGANPYLDQFILEFVDGETLSLLQEGFLLLPSVGRLLTPCNVLLPLWDVRWGHAGTPDLGGKLSVSSYKNQVEF